MIRKLIIIFIALSFFSVCFAGSIQDMHKAAIARKNISCYDCDSDDATFLWECNSTTVGTGTPCGCSDGDTTTSANDEATITAGACVFDDTGGTPDGLDFFPFDVSSDDIFDDSIGTVFINFKVDTFVDDVTLLYVYKDDDNRFRVKIDNSDEVSTVHEGQNNSQWAATTDSPVSTGVIYIVRVKWEVGGTPDLAINIFNEAMVEQGSGATNDTPLTLMNPEPGAGGLQVGNGLAVGVGANFTIYYIHIYNTLKDTDPNG